MRMLLRTPVYDRYVPDESWNEGAHPRGQPGNPGQFAPKPGGGTAKGEGGSKGSPSSSGPTGAALKVEIQHHKARVKSAVETYRTLNQLAGLHTKAGNKDSREAFIIKNGAPFVANAKTYEGKRGEMKQCYMNATKQAMNNPDRTYVEGYIMAHGVPIHHAWTVDKTGQIYDPTLTSDLAKGVTGYFGVPFDTKYLIETTLKNKHYGLLGSLSKNAKELFEGKQSGFKAKEDVDSLSNESIGDRLAFADTVSNDLSETTDKINTPERQELREHIANEYYNNTVAKAKPNRTVTLVLGLPGAGKSTFINPLRDGGAAVIDNDEIKAHLPEFNGGVGANLVHEEASSIARNVRNRAIAEGRDFVWERIDSPDKVEADVGNLKKAGYKVNVIFVDAPQEIAVESAIRRYFNSGRYVSPTTIRNYGNSPEEAYNLVKNLQINNHQRYKRTAKGIEEV